MSMKGSNFVFDCVQLLYYKCHKINSSCGAPNIDSSDWIKNEKSSNKSFQWK